MSIRYIGYPCINMALSDGVSAKQKVYTSRTMRLSGFSLPKAGELALANAKDLLTILQWNQKHGVMFFRIGSDIFPFMDHPAVAYKLEALPQAKDISSVFSMCEKVIRESGMRVSCHPGPYNCLGSVHGAVVHKTILSLEMHRMIGELLGYEDFAINLHVGGKFADDLLQRFLSGFKMLSSQTQQWLTLENDDKASCWSITKLYKLYLEVGAPLVLDIHHWSFCNNESLAEAAAIAFSTWSGRVPKVHYSESRALQNSYDVDRKPQAHSDYLAKPVPDFPSEFDVMLECKQKDRALLKYRLDFRM